MDNDRSRVKGWKRRKSILCPGIISLGVLPFSPNSSPRNCQNSPGINHFLAPSSLQSSLISITPSLPLFAPLKTTNLTASLNLLLQVLRTTALLCTFFLLTNNVNSILQLFFPAFPCLNCCLNSSALMNG